MKVLAALAFLVGFTTAAAGDPARSVISLNLCTDQLLLALAPESRIVGLSPFTERSRAPHVGGPPILSGTAEEALLLRPDLVVAGLWDRRATQAMIRQQGIRLEAFDIVASLAEARTQITRMGDLLGERPRADILVAELDAALGRLRAAAAGQPLRVLPYSRRGWVEGSEGLIGEILREAGLLSAAGEAGIRMGGFLGLEAVVSLRPDALLLTDGERLAEDQGAALLQHPAIARMFPESRLLRLPGSRAICGGPGLVRALDSLAAQIADLPRPR